MARTAWTKRGGPGERTSACVGGDRVAGVLLAGERALGGVSSSGLFARRELQVRCGPRGSSVGVSMGQGEAST